MLLGDALSCQDMQISVDGAGRSTTSCYALNACDGLTLSIDAAHYQTHFLSMYSHSADVVFSNGVGLYDYDVDDTVQFVTCGEEDRWVKWNESLNATSALETVALNEFNSATFPCQDGTILCLDNDDDEDISSCEMDYLIDDGYSPAVSLPSICATVTSHCFLGQTLSRRC